MIDPEDFPHLTTLNHRVTSPATQQYNCIAWAVNDHEHWWQPGEFWPIETYRENASIDALIQMFQHLGFQHTSHHELEDGFEKIVLYEEPPFYTHAARQLPNGKWTSKLGRQEDIEHETPECITGGAYGKIACAMKRMINHNAE